MKKSVIEIRCKDNSINKVEGYVENGYGIHKDGNTWRVTHLASGLSCGVNAKTRKGAFESLADVEKFINANPDKVKNAIAKFNELRGVKTMKKTSKKTTSKSTSKAKKPTMKDTIARLERENAELKARLESLETPTSNGLETFDVEQYLATRDNENRITPELVNAISETKGLKVERRGADEWLYVTGDTKPLKDIFKAMGFRFSGKECAWFLAPYPLKSPKRYGKSATVNA